MDSALMDADKIQILDSQLTAQVVNHIRAKIEDGTLKPGDKIPPERELSKTLNVSRASLRTGIAYLAAMGVMKVRRGARTAVAHGPGEIGRLGLELLGALHGLEPWQIFEVRVLLETNLASLAAMRGREEHFMALAEEIADMYATIGDPAQYLIHDARFHRAIAEASGNPMLAALTETVSTALYDERRKTAERAQDRKRSIEMHREIYRAIRAGNPAEAQVAMERHLHCSDSKQAAERPVSRDKNGRPQRTKQFIA